MPNQNSESIAEKDAEQVDAAVELLLKGRVEDAAKLLLDVIQRTPKPYIRDFEADGKRFIRFWDTEEFMHFVTAHRGQLKTQVIWLKSAYPRAYYYLGFASVKAGDAAGAIRYLDAGYQVEAHPIFLAEKGKALAMQKRHEEALACYEAAFNHEGLVRATLRAVALRGKGVQLIDLNRLDEAEQVFEASLKLDPNNSVALNELAYIAQLRRGKPQAPLATVVAGGKPLACAICGTPLERSGKVHNIDGRVVVRCERCAALLPITGGTSGLPQRRRRDEHHPEEEAAAKTLVGVLEKSVSRQIVTRHRNLDACSPKLLEHPVGQVFQSRRVVLFFADSAEP